MKPFPSPRRPTRLIRVGPVAVGGGSPITVQTMVKADPHDAAAILAQIRRAAAVGCDIIRMAIPDEAAARVLADVRRESPLPIVADIHFRHTLALRALEAGCDGLRLNPGNIGGADRVREVVRAARERHVPIRIGVNSGSLSNAILERFGGPTAEALVESALEHVRLLEEADYREIKISVKASDPVRTVQAYRRLAERTSYPLHLGVTEAGTRLAGTVRSCAALAVLLGEGIGDTLRISLTDEPEEEVRVGLELLRSLGLREGSAAVIACPTCGRTRIPVAAIAREVESALEALRQEYPGRSFPRIAVMGCVVNGPGEAREADVAAAGGDGIAVLYRRGQPIGRVPADQIARALVEEVRRWLREQGGRD